MRAIIAGYVPRLRDPDTATSYLPAITPPSNYKNPETIQKWVETNLPIEEAKRELMLKVIKATGDLFSVYAVDLYHREIFDSTQGSHKNPLAMRFAHWLLRGWSFRDVEDSPEVFGFAPKTLMRLTGVNAIRGGMRVPRFLWYQATDSLCFDPKEMLLESFAKELIPLEKLCAEAPGGEIVLPANYQPHVDAKMDVSIVTKMVLQYQLTALDSADTKFLRKQVDAGLTGEDNALHEPAPEGEEVPV